MNVGLAASRALRQGARSQLTRLLKRHAPFLRSANLFAFARKHFALLSRFQARVATGTTGGLLNAMARKRGARDWVLPMLSGPLGGDAQIARLLLEGKCDRVIFFEDPHVAREHEADIQLLERAARVVGDRAICISDPGTAERWAQSARPLAA